MPLAFHWDSNEAKRLLCSTAKVSVVSVSLPLSAVIPALARLDCSFRGIVLSTLDQYLDSRHFFGDLDFE